MAYKNDCQMLIDETTQVLQFLLHQNFGKPSHTFIEERLIKRRMRIAKNTVNVGNDGGTLI
jgi:hypothetical protein